MNDAKLTSPRVCKSLISHTLRYLFDAASYHYNYIRGCVRPYVHLSNGHSLWQNLRFLTYRARQKCSNGHDIATIAASECPCIVYTVLDSRTVSLYIYRRIPLHHAIPLTISLKSCYNQITLSNLQNKPKSFFDFFSDTPAFISPIPLYPSVGVFQNEWMSLD